MKQLCKVFAPLKRLAQLRIGGNALALFTLHRGVEYERLVCLDLRLDKLLQCLSRVYFKQDQRVGRGEEFHDWVLPQAL